MAVEERLLASLTMLFADHASGHSQVQKTGEKLELTADWLLRMEPIEHVDAALALIHKTRAELMNLRERCLFNRIERLLRVYEQMTDGERATERAAYEQKFFRLFEQASGWEVDTAALLPLQERAKQFFCF